MNIILTLLILGVIILIHELGHFLAAKFYKMPVAEFAIGMGPKLFTYHGTETDYSIRAIPMGGFVNIEGMDIDNPVENGFNSKKPHERFVVLFAGVFMNFMLALVIVMGLAFSQGGEYRLKNEAYINRVIEGTGADGILKDGDRILEINGQKMKLWTDINDFTSKANSPEIDLLIQRAGKEIELSMDMVYDEGRKMYLIGIQPGYNFYEYSSGESLQAGWKMYKGLYGSVFTGLKMLLSGQVKGKDMAGPVGLVRVVDNFASGGAKALIMLVAMLSINIGIFNLLPFPALDGGRIIFVILELIGIKVNKKIEERVHMIGMLILFGLIFLITANDLKNIFG